MEECRKVLDTVALSIYTVLSSSRSSDEKRSHPHIRTDFFNIIPPTENIQERGHLGCIFHGVQSNGWHPQRRLIILSSKDTIQVRGARASKKIKEESARDSKSPMLKVNTSKIIFFKKFSDWWDSSINWLASHWVQQSDRGPNKKKLNLNVIHLLSMPCFEFWTQSQWLPRRHHRGFLQYLMLRYLLWLSTLVRAWVKFLGLDQLLKLCDNINDIIKNRNILPD